MLWSTLHHKIGKQPLSFTNHNHVKAVIDNKEYKLDLKYDTKGHPYLIARTTKTRKEQNHGICTHE